MLITFQASIGATVVASDGSLGALGNLIFLPASWDIRYLSITTGRVLPPRRVFLSPRVVDRLDWARGSIRVRVTVAQADKMPEPKSELPSPHEEQELIAYFGWPPYRETPTSLVTEHMPRLWGTQSLLEYGVAAEDGDVGYVQDIIFDDESWKIRYLVVDLGSRVSGRRILMSPEWIREMDWESRVVRSGLITAQLESGPAFDPRVPINRDDEERLYDYYGRPKYWEQPE